MSSRSAWPAWSCSCGRGSRAATWKAHERRWTSSGGSPRSSAPIPCWRRPRSPRASSPPRAETRIRLVAGSRTRWTSTTAGAAPFEAAGARHELARTLDALGRGDAAEEERRAARAALERLGATSPPEARAGAPEGLTRRELEVLRLIARGRSNREIAAAGDLEDDVGHPVGPMLYAASLYHCMSVSLAQGGEGLGAMWGERRAREVLERVGFDVEPMPLEGDLLHTSFVARPRAAA
jgi:hypothetical protein